MENLNEYRDLIERILAEYARVPYAHGDIARQTVFDRDRDHYLVLSVGREGGRRVHGCVIHVDIIDGKFWIQRDGSEEGIAVELMRAGVPRDRIVLGFKSPELRPMTEFAPA